MRKIRYARARSHHSFGRGAMSEGCPDCELNAIMREIRAAFAFHVYQTDLLLPRHGLAPGFLALRKTFSANTLDHDNTCALVIKIIKTRGGSKIRIYPLEIDGRPQILDYLEKIMMHHADKIIYSEKSLKTRREERGWKKMFPWRDMVDVQLELPLDS